MPDFLGAAREAALLAGQYLLENRGKISPDQVDEKAKNDFVTRVDRKSEKLIVGHLLGKFPGHQILAEEGTRQDSAGNYRWIIDPLDGTKNYIQNVPTFSVSIALQKSLQPVLGVVYDPVHHELFSAENGAGAFCNEEQIRVSEQNFQYALIATGFPHKRKRILPKYLLTFEEVFLKCSGMRRCGSAALDLCHVACGRYEGFWEPGLSIWDIAAGSLIVREAGGKVFDFRGEENYLNNGNIIAGNQEVGQELLKIIKTHFSFS